VWDCLSRAQTLAATFEVHEAALQHGFLPDEATTLSLTLAELAMRAVKEGKGAVASCFFSADGWRLELVDFACPELQVDSSALLRSLTSVRVHPRPGGGAVVIANYRRTAHA
jgi:hypothetical protein